MSGKKIRLDQLDMKARFATQAEYEARLAELQRRMLHVQQAYYHEKRRAVILFEGWDAAGKGGAIRRLIEPLDPRGCIVWPIGPPTPDEQGRHYLYRFWTRLPVPGTLAVFDRSWYGRVLVERVEGLVRHKAWRRAYDEINEFERMLTDDGVRVVKLFLHITADEQLRRFAERLRNPYKRWKLTEEDIRNREKGSEYLEAIEEMFDRTSTERAPWRAIAANYKWQARTAVLEAVTEHLSAGVNLVPPPLDPAVQRAAARRLGLDIDAILGGKRNGSARAAKKRGKRARAS